MKAPIAVNYKQGTPFPKTNEQLFHDAQKKISDKVCVVVATV
jgi:hypothetical protein